MLEILTKICDGKGETGDIETLERLANIIQNTALCGLGQTAPNPVLSTLRYFRGEYEAHIHKKRCTAAVCQAMVKAPCRHTCPIGMNVPGYIALIRAGRLEDAYRLLLKTNPFPGVCGRVCDHRCEAKCRRATIDAPLGIKNLKRFVTDNTPRPKVERVAVVHKEQIAVIGAGPSGLTVAKDLALRGYGVTIFEQFSEPGGMLRWGIPAYRLPRNILKQEIDDILNLGIGLKCNARVGTDISWPDIKKKFDAVYLATGIHKSMPMDMIDGRLSGVWGAIEFLRTVNSDNPPCMGKNVAVVGGGNSAIDAARSALRLGAKEVTILYRRNRQDMPALEEEICAAIAEGVKLKFMVTPVRTEGINGKLLNLICQNMALGDFDISARRKSVPKSGDEFTLNLDQLIIAIGQKPDHPFDLEEAGIQITKTGLIEVEEHTITVTSAPMVFAGGDAVKGPDTVVQAIAAGHESAKEIDEAIRRQNGGEKYLRPEQEIEIPSFPDEEILEIQNVSMAEAVCSLRIKDFQEVELGFSREEAFKEAQRCVRCDIET